MNLTNQIKMHRNHLHPFDLHQSTSSIYHDPRQKHSGHHGGKSGQHLTISLRGSTRNLKRSSQCGLSSTHEIQTPKMKNHVHLGKNMSKRLFQRAKIINDPSKQTFLSTSQKQTQKHSLHVPSQSSQVFSHVFDLKKIRSQSTRRKKLKDSNKKSDQSQTSSKHIKSSSAKVKKDKSDSSGKRTEQNDSFKLDEEQNKLIEENNLFGSRTGQQLLSSLNRKLSRISSIEKRKSNEDLEEIFVSKTHAKSSNMIRFSIKKIDSYDLDTEDSFIRQNQVSSVLKVDEQQEKPIKKEDDMTTFSKLIMEDNYKI